MFFLSYHCSKLTKEFGMSYGVDMSNERVLVGTRDDIMRSVSIEVNPKFLDHQGDLSVVETDILVQELSKDIFDYLNQTSKLKFMINFKTDMMGNYEVKNPKRTFFYLKAIDKALREYKEINGKTPAVGIYMHNAGISDEMMPIITKLVEDRLIGAQDPDLNTSIIELKNNQLTPKSLLSFATAIKSTDVWSVNLRGNKLDQKTEIALNEWKNAPLPFRCDENGKILNLNPRYLYIF